MLETLLISSAIGAGVNALDNLFSTDPAEEMQKKLNKVLEQLDNMKISASEERSKVDEVADVYNTNMLNSLNDTTVGVSLSGVSNPEVIRAEQTSQLLGERSKATLAEKRRIEELNNTIELQKAQLEMGTPVSTKPSVFSSVLSGGIQGATVGLQVAGMEEQAEFNNSLLDILDKSSPTGEVKAPTTNLTDATNQILTMSFPKKEGMQLDLPYFDMNSPEVFSNLFKF